MLQLQQEFTVQEMFCSNLRSLHDVVGTAPRAASVTRRLGRQGNWCGITMLSKPRRPLKPLGSNCFFSDAMAMNPRIVAVTILEPTLLTQRYKVSPHSHSTMFASESDSRRESAK